MELRNKIIAGLTVMGIVAGTTAEGLDKQCVFDEVILNVKAERICFPKKADYKVYKNSMIEKIKVGSMALYGPDGEEIMAVLNKEIKDSGGVIGDFNDKTDMLVEIIKLAENNS